MMARSQTTDRELFLILITVFMLAFAARVVEARSSNTVAASPIATAEHQSTSAILDAAANPYWAPAHAFARRLAPIYSDATPTAMSHIAQK